MDLELWTEVDRYIDDHLLPADEALQRARAASREAGLARGSIAPNQGKLLEILARAVGARRILELGTLGGYSTIWLARSLPAGGRLISLEVHPGHAAVARANVATAGLADTVEIRVGPALETLPELLAEEAGPFDVIFIDADKSNNPEYLEWSLRLSRAGTLLIADNVVRGGVILDPLGSDPRLGEGGVQGLRRFYEMIAAEPRLSATAIQTVGIKGHDGLLLALVGDPGEED